MKKTRNYNPHVVIKAPEPVILKHLEVEVKDGDVEKAIKKFTKKVRKEEILKPYYDRLMFFTSKSEKKRQNKRKKIFEQKNN